MSYRSATAWYRQRGILIRNTLEKSKSENKRSASELNKIGGFISSIFGLLNLRIDPVNNIISEISRQFGNDILDPIDYGEEFLFYHYTNSINHFNSRKRISPYKDINDSGISLYFLKEFLFYLYSADQTESTLEKKYYFLISQYFLRLFTYNSYLVVTFNEEMSSNMVNIYIRNIFDPKIADEVKALRQLGIKEKIGLTDHGKEKVRSKISFLSEVDFPYYNYDDTLHEDYMINWKIEPDDFSVVFEPVDKEIPTEFFDHLRCFLRQHLFLNIIPDQDEINTWINTKTTLDREKQFRTFYKKNQDIFYNFLNSESLTFERLKVYVSPANARDAWRGTPETYLFLKFYDKIINQIVSKHSKSAMGINEGLFESRLFRIMSHEGNYTMVDTKKSGLTLPHNLIKGVLSVIQEELNIDLSLYIDKIDRIQVYDEGNPHTPKRGVGLGMANSIVTLINCIVMDSLGLDGIAYNDDTVFCTNDIDQMYSIEEFYNNELGWEIKEEKSLISDSFIFLEEYYLQDGAEKDQRLIFPLVDFLFEENIYKLKSKFVNFRRSQRVDIPDLFLSFFELYDQFRGSEFDVGFESSHMEKILPLEYGGWELRGPRLTDPIFDQCHEFNEIELIRLSNIFDNYKIFNQIPEVKLKNYIPYKWKLYELEVYSEKGNYVKENMGFVPIYKMLERSMNFVPLDELSNTKLNKLWGNFLSKRKSIWFNGQTNQICPENIFWVKDLELDSRNFSLNKNWIKYMQTIPCQPREGTIYRMPPFFMAKPIERAIATLKALKLGFRTNYPREVIPELCYDDEEYYQSLSVNGLVIDQAMFSSEVLEELKKISSDPLKTLLDYQVRNKVIVRKLTLKDSINLKELYPLEAEIITVGKGKFEILVGSYRLLVNKTFFELYEEILYKNRQLLRMVYRNIKEDNIILSMWRGMVLLRAILENKEVTVGPNTFFINLDDESEELEDQDLIGIDDILRNLMEDSNITDLIKEDRELTFDPTDRIKKLMEDSDDESIYETAKEDFDDVEPLSNYWEDYDEELDYSPSDREELGIEDYQLNLEL